MVKCLPSVSKALHLILSTKKKKQLLSALASHKGTRPGSLQAEARMEILELMIFLN
jgi:hypothetical protein